ncbi:MAG: DUF2470 domain-containing protein [Deltaproteobacteria bacterium]|nr:MAG: DUF2470 domain-containing protein [Deltaproteobacteria bacterium]
MTDTTKTEESFPENERLHRSTYNPREGHVLPTHGDYARTITVASHQGVLSTIDREDGTPYGSIVELLPLPNGDFAFFVSGMADHTKNLKKNPQCSILVAEGFGQGYALALSRATYMGKATKVTEDLESLREGYLKLHPEAHVYIDFPDFVFYQLKIERVRYIGGFGRMSWVEGGEYQSASPDPLWEKADGIIQHMNEDHQHNLRDYAHAFGKVEGDIDSIVMTCVDRFGFEMRARQGEREHTVRISFSEEVTDPKRVRHEMVALAQQAREALGKPATKSSGTHN